MTQKNEPLITALYERLSRDDDQQLLADIEAGMVKTVLIKDMRRVGRSYVETGFYTEVYFGRMGVRFIAINNNIDNDNPESTEFAGTGHASYRQPLRHR